MAIDPTTGLPANSTTTPFFFEAMEMLPGLTTTAVINANRYANTIMKGGIYDIGQDVFDQAGQTGRGSRRARRKVKRAQKMGAFIGDDLAVKAGDSRMFLFGKPGADKTPFIRQSARTNLNPRAAFRLGSTSQLAGESKLGFYTPFQGIPALANRLAFDKAGDPRQFLAKRFGLEKGDVAYSGGVLGRIETMNRLYKVDRKIAAGGRGAEIARAQKARMIENITKVQQMTQGQAAREAAGRTARKAAADFGINLGASNPLVSTVEDSAEAAAKKAAAAAVADDPLQAVSSTMTRGKISNAITRYYAGVLDPTKMTAGQKEAVKAVMEKLGGNVDDFARTFKYAEKGLFKGGAGMVSTAFRGAMAGGSKAAAAKVAAMGGVRMLGAAMPGINVIMYGQLMYDITKGLGKIAVRGVNLARDAMKSMQGTINKPLFGTGFVDNEVAASSRARGVMAIQNSRLNARSLLGSEAAMMAAHFG